jgi:hypothetical protein
MSPILGIMASQISGHLETGAFESIATYTPTSGSSITFSSIPANYKSLQIRGVMLGTSAFNVSMQLNSDTGSNYSVHRLSGNGSTPAAAGQTNTVALYGSPNGVVGSVTYPTAFILDLIDYYSTSKYKTTKQFMGIDLNGSGEVALWSGNWRSTAAINSVTVFLTAGSFASGTSIALYGVK